MDFTGSFGHCNRGVQSAINTGTINTQFNIHTDSDPLEKLIAAQGAELDSYSDQHDDECLEGTRIDILRDIAEWAVSPHGKCIFWLNGMAGTGKSTISRTVAGSLRNHTLVMASFFFKRGEGNRGNATMFFSTISRQLARKIPALAVGLRKVLSVDPDITAKSLHEQFKHLLLQPLKDLEQADPQPLCIVMIIDALDECEPDNDIRVILQLLPQLQDINTVRLRVFLTSRPELPIRLGFSRMARDQYQDFALHQIPEKVTSHDISLFLNHRFSMIQDEKDVPADWPGNDLIQALVDISVPLFISAATICRFVENNLDPVESLAALIRDQSNYPTRMEKTYLPILDRLLHGQHHEDANQIFQHFQQVIGVLILLAIPLSVNALSRLLGLRTILIKNLLNSFQSVLSLPREPDLPVRTLHLSFRDFLLQTTSKFHINEEVTHKNIAVYCFASMRLQLKINICNLDSYGESRTEIMPEKVNQHIPSDLHYSCRYWVYHLEQCADRDAMIQHAYEFLQEHFLHWVEAMSLLGIMSDVIRMVETIQMITQADPTSTISDFLHDARRFILKYHQIVDETPLQIYCAGLVFAPKTSIISRQFQTEIPSWIYKLPQANKKWDTELQTLEGHSGAVTSVAFSPDGSLLASGSDDETVRIWYSATGVLQQTLEGHHSKVTSVAFSPDSKLLASGSKDETVHIWDLATGMIQQILDDDLCIVSSLAFSPDGRLLAASSTNWGEEPEGLVDMIWIWDLVTAKPQRMLEGVSAGVTSLVFSPGGQVLASSSCRLDLNPSDVAIQLWNPATGTLEGTIKDQSDEVESRGVNSVVFTPNGRLLASGSDYGVQLWDLATGELQKTLEGYSGSVESVAISPDGRLLASGSSVDNSYVEIWDLATGVLQRTLKSHTDTVTSVSFSPKSQLLASGSSDGTVRIWDSATSPLVQEAFHGHQEWVSSLVFSPDGCLLASGSNDKIICLWDPVTCTQKQTLEGHSKAIDQVFFSSNSLILASTSYDKTIRLWDIATGVLQHTLESHSGMALSVAFSSDSQLLASISPDMEIRLWDTATGALKLTIETDSCWDPLLEFLPRNESLAFSSRSQVVRLWDPFTGLVQQKKALGGRLNQIRDDSSVTFSPDGRMLALIFGGNVQLWDSDMDTLRQTLKGHSFGFNSVAFSPDSRLLASANSWEVQIWETSTGTLQKTWKHEKDFYKSFSKASVAFSADGQLLASTGGQTIIQVWDLGSGALRQTIEGHSKHVQSIDFSPDSSILASASGDSTVRLWNTATGTLRNILNGHRSQVLSLAFSPDGQLLASISQDTKIRLWDPATDTLQRILNVGSTGTGRKSLAFSPDSQLLAVSSSTSDWHEERENRCFQLWNIATGTLQQNLTNDSFPIDSMAFSPNGSLLWISYDATVRFWNPVTGTLQKTLTDFPAAITSMAFSPNSRHIALSLKNNTVQVWELDKSRLKQTLEGHSARVISMAFSPDSCFLASGSHDETVRIWNPITGQLRQIVSLYQIPSQISFSQDGSYLNTNAGSLHIQSQCNNSTAMSVPSQRGLDMLLHKEHWLMMNNEKALRIPVELRPTCSAAFGSILALGHQSGQVSLIGFSQAQREPAREFCEAGAKRKRQDSLI